MLKKILALLFFFSITSDLLAQLNFDEILNLDPHTRAQYLNSSPDWINSESGGNWYPRNYYRGSQGLVSNNYYVVFRKLLKDEDNDNIGNPDEYIALLYTEFDFLTGNGYGFRNYTIFNFPITDSSNNQFIEEKKLFLAISNFNGFNYIRYEHRSGYDDSRNNTQMAVFIQDCDDSNPNIPNGFERRYIDSDGDGYGFGSVIEPSGCQNYSTVVINGDCNDNNSSITTTPINWYHDGDRDGYGDPNNFVTSCEFQYNYVLNNEDCNDNNERFNIILYTWYADFDGDGFGDENNTIQATCQPQDYIIDCFFDECPNIYGTLDGCPQIDYSF